MSRKQVIKNIVVGLAILIIFAAFLYDFYLNPNFLGYEFSVGSLSAMSLALLAFLLSRRWARSLSIYAIVKVILLLLIILNATHRIFPIDHNWMNKNGIDFPVFIVFSLDLIFLGVLLSLLKELIFVQRKKNTAKNFVFLMVFLFSFSLLNQAVHFSTSLSSMRPTGLASDNLLYVFVILMMIFSMIVNSFRLRWIRFLNKGQKIKTLFWSIGIISLSGVMLQNITYMENDVNDVAYRFSNVGLIFSILYFSFSLILILLYLPTAGSLDRRAKELSSLQQLSRSMIGVFDLNKIFEIILRQTIDITGSNFSWLMLKESGRRSFHLVAEQNLPDKIREIFENPGHLSVVKWINESKSVLMIDRVSKDERVADIFDWKHRSGSLLGIPLISNKKVLGILFAVKNIDYGFLADDRSLLAMFANNAAIAIENAQLVEKSLAKEKYEQELKVAHEAQMKLLPAKTPELPHLEISAICKTANEVGGDYYDFFMQDKCTLGVAIGDVSGKGAEAAFYMAEGKGILESLCQTEKIPAQILQKANEVLYKTLDAKTFISMLYGSFDLRTRVFRFARAGHCPVLYWKNKEKMVYLVEPSGMALGLVSGKIFRKTLDQEEIHYRKGDLFVLCTDGVTEAMNEKQQEFGEDRLCDVVYENHEKSASEIQAAILAEIDNFTGTAKQHDDLSLVVIKPK